LRYNKLITVIIIIIIIIIYIYILNMLLYLNLSYLLLINPQKSIHILNHKMYFNSILILYSNIFYWLEFRSPWTSPLTQKSVHLKPNQLNSSNNIYKFIFRCQLHLYSHIYFTMYLPSYNKLYLPKLLPNTIIFFQTVFTQVLLITRKMFITYKFFIKLFQQ